MRIHSINVRKHWIYIVHSGASRYSDKRRADCYNRNLICEKVFHNFSRFWNIETTKMWVYIRFILGKQFFQTRQYKFVSMKYYLLWSHANKIAYYENVPFISRSLFKQKLMWTLYKMRKIWMHQGIFDWKRSLLTVTSFKICEHWSFILWNRCWGLFWYRKNRL